MSIFSRIFKSKKDQTGKKPVLEKKAPALKLKEDKKPELKLKEKIEKGGADSSKKDTSKKDDTKSAYRVLIKPVVTEKATNLSASRKYVFEVSPRANKIEVAKAINAVYGVKPVNVRIMVMRGKNVRYGRVSGKTKFWKKAIVTLKPEDKIEIYEGV